MRHKGSTYVTAGLLAALFFANCANSARAVDAERCQHDERGRLTGYTAPDGSKTNYHYNAAGALTEVCHRGGRTRFGYDVTGNRAWMADQTGLTQYYYDAFDRLSAMASRHGPWRMTFHDYYDRHNLTHTWIKDLELRSDLPSCRSAMPA